MENWVNAGKVADLKTQKTKVLKGGIVVFFHEGQVYALDNRCPHMGFPLHMGSLCNGILTCHWHHARFDVCSGGTLDPWADDVPSYEVKLEEGEIWINCTSKSANQLETYKARLVKGLEQNLSLVIAKAVVSLIKANADESEIIKIGVAFGTSQRSAGWGPGLTILTCMANVLPKLDMPGRIQALYQGLAHVANDCAGRPPRHFIGPLSGYQGNLQRLKEWYRDCIEVRDTQGAERIVLTAAEQGMDVTDLSSMMNTAVTDHFYIDGGHTLDFHNKAFEVLQYTGEEAAAPVLASLTPLFANATRSEELHRWQSPVDLVTPLEHAFDTLKSIDFNRKTSTPIDEEHLLEKLLANEPLDMIESLTENLVRNGDPVRIAQIVALAAAERIVRFHTQNDFRDWITVLHTFTHAHAVHEMVGRSEEPLLLRGIYHGAVSIFLDRFLNIPATKRPVAGKEPAATLDSKAFLHLLDKQQQVNEAGKWVVNYLHKGGDKQALFNTFGHAVLREDANFHTYQLYEAACAEYDHWENEETPFAERAKETLLIAMARYLAAHAPTSREMPHIGTIAWRLNLGEKLFEEE
ncbi:Ferredoxin subunit of nitrite reductase or a ring-hydroxylating dioxygenase [Evansella caseinilytica]|uniref:Ferredoxin subunit of nitrite reductase or a ring-hydroxylating dioxygenase n=1 Tax=Evansella caseinilytica TaxID=1503961 RepID=A0A1H3UME6_9BACI|nr:Ferredoxin subunit of nitrite reductase or a ring-hydroxylating dioxygenase [Evansella caseinilytica]